MKKSLTLFYEYSSKYKPRYRLHEQRHWALKGSRMVFPRAYISPQIREVIGTVPEEMLHSTRYEEEIKRNTTIDFDEFLKYKKPNLKKLFIEHDPINEIERPESFSFSQRNRFEFGDLQASLLTKTKIMNDDLPILPETIISDDAKSILDRFILKANWWITDEHKFPKRFVPRIKLFKNKIEFGIDLKNSIRYLFNDLFQYSDYLTTSTEIRMFNKDHFIDTFYNWKDRRIQFTQNRDFLISGSQPLKVFKKEFVEWQPKEMELIMEPVDPTVDLKIIKHYNLDSSDGWKANDVKCLYPHILTVNLDLPNIHTDFLEPEARQITQSEKNAIGIMNCFMQCVATARRLFGNDAVDNCHGKLPHAICVQAIMFDTVQLDFVYYQLNSTDFSNDDVANVAWIDSGHNLYKKLYRSKSMLRNTRYENLDLDVFRKFLSFYRYGCH